MAEDSFKSEYKKIDMLLSSSLRYQVPPYQRDFSWESNDQIVDFWSDLNESMKRNKDHFFGNILLRKTENEDMFDILDGQQRLVTVTILLAVIRDELYKIGDADRSNIIQQSIAITTDETTLKPIERLKLNLRNKAFFLDFVQLHKSDPQRKSFESSENLMTTNKLIMDAYNYLQKEIEKELDSLSTRDEKTKFLTSVSSHLKKRFGLIETRVGSTAEAYRLFMPLNFRGLELSVADLFKSYIIEESPPEKREDVITIWNEIADLLDEAGLVNFLRHYWASKIDNVGEKDLYDEFVDYIDTQNIDVVTFVKKLREEAEIYSALLNSQSDYWKGKDKRIPELLEEVRTLNIRQCFPLLLSGRKKFDDKNFRKLLETCINFSFRFITIGGLNNKLLESLYSNTAIEVSKDKIKDIDSIVKILKKEYIKDEDFLTLFIRKQIKINKIARYILQKIEDSFSDKEKVYKIITLEHVLPDNPDKEWEAYLKAKKLEKDELVDKIGNMTLLTEKMNSNAQNKFFTKKRDEYYKKSILKINENLKNINEWTDKEIKERQAWLGEIAIKLWKLD